ncbi:bacillithiol biosynthesis cysteine-adding enzyme BshC [Phosphitispora fastidiosa]|uniref:bacillithiol biosynthesis cysteine-adding enzyme BshC n=1 Tax=Phosphitispora fastidiosa TaxID=2837202 RepID=UPI001E3D28BC|nr:bacillithiol biosynthesis cysteine-adding enzyme BshC [Phosphitispora fastidiosa]MBU7008627.1 bacillithiol biosynthesis cysteine-adding enzyme BshC [Phosphitispora fastidiosa]
MKLESAAVQYKSPLVNMYLNDFQQVAHLFEHDPGNPGSFADRHDIIMRDYHTDRKTLVCILTEYNETLQCGGLTRQNLQKLEDPGTTVVITGQQAGVFTGPLYTIYKAITAVQLAAELTARTGRSVIPMFWVAAEDHDFAEVDHIYVINREKNIERLRLKHDPGGKYSIGHVRVDEAVFDLIARLEECTNPSEWKGEILEKVSEMARNSANLAEWFARIMTWLFKDHGLVMVNPLLRELRRLWSGTFEEFLGNSAPVSAKLSAVADLVRDLGVEPQVEKDNDNANMFIYVNGERLPLFRLGESFGVRGGAGEWTLEELLAAARETPELFSPNVVLRPVAQDVLLPIMAYIAGPGEISYYALYRDIYRLFNQRMPVIYPRANISLIEPGIAKSIKEYGVSLAEGVEGLHRELQKQLEDRDVLGIDKMFDAYAAEVEQSYRNFILKVAGTDKELTGHGKESQGKLLHQLEYFRKKTHQYHRKSCDTLVTRFNNIEKQLFPRNNWQERVYNILPYLFKYRSDFINDLAGLPLLGNNDHKLLYI